MRLLVNNIDDNITEFLNAYDCDSVWSRTSLSYSSKFACNFFYSSRHFFVNVLPVLHAFIRVLVFALVF